MWFSTYPGKDEESINSHFDGLYPRDLDKKCRNRKKFKEATIEDLKREFNQSLSKEAISTSNFRTMSGFFYTSIYESFESEIIQTYDFADLEEFSNNDEDEQFEEEDDCDYDYEDDTDLQLQYKSSLAYNIAQSPQVAGFSEEKIFHSTTNKISDSLDKISAYVDEIDKVKEYDENLNKTEFRNEEDINAQELENKLLEIFYKKYKQEEYLSSPSPFTNQNSNLCSIPPIKTTESINESSPCQFESSSSTISSHISPPTSPVSPSKSLEPHELEEYEKLQKFSSFFQLPPYYFLKNSKILLLNLKKLKSNNNSAELIQDIVENYDEKKEKILMNIIGLIIKNLNLFFYYFNTIKKLKHSLLLILKSIKKSKRRLNYCNQNLYNIVTSNMSLNNRYKNYKSLLEISKNLKLVKDYYVFIKKNSFNNFFNYFNYNAKSPQLTGMSSTSLLSQQSSFINPINQPSIFYPNSLIVLYYIKLDKYLSKYSSVNTINEIKNYFPYYILLLKFKLFLNFENFFLRNSFSSIAYINFLYNIIYLDILYEHSNNSLILENFHKIRTQDSSSVQTTGSEFSKDFIPTNNFLINTQQTFPPSILSDIKHNYTQKQYFEIFNNFSLNFSECLINEFNLTSYLPTKILKNLDNSINFQLKKIFFINLWTNKPENSNKEDKSPNSEKNFFKDFFNDYFYNQNKNEKNFSNFSNFLNNFNFNFFFNISSLQDQLSSIGYFCTQVFQILKFYHDLNIFHIKLFLFDINKLNDKTRRENKSPYSSSHTTSSFDSPISTPTSIQSCDFDEKSKNYSEKYDELLRNYEEVHSPYKKKMVNSSDSSIQSKTNISQLESISFKENSTLYKDESHQSLPYVLTSSIKSDITMDSELLKNHEEYERNFIMNQEKLRNLETNNNKLNFNAKNKLFIGDNEIDEENEEDDAKFVTENSVEDNNTEKDYLVKINDDENISPTMTSSSSFNILPPLNCKDPSLLQNATENPKIEKKEGIENNKVYENLFYIVKKKSFFTNLNINKDLLKIISIRYYNIRKRILSNYSFIIKKIFFILIKIIRKLSFYNQSYNDDSEKESKTNIKIKQKKTKKSFFFMLHSLHGLFYFIKNYNIKGLESFFEDNYKGMMQSETNIDNNPEESFFEFVQENYEKFEKINDDFLYSCQLNEKFFPKFEENDENFNIFNENFKKFFSKTKNSSTCPSETLTPSNISSSLPFDNIQKKFTFSSIEDDSFFNFYTSLLNRDNISNQFNFYKNFMDEDSDSIDSDSFSNKSDELNNFHEALNSSDNDFGDIFIRNCSVNRIFLFLIELLQFKVEEFMNQNHHNSMNDLKQLISMDSFTPSYIIKNKRESNNMNSFSHFNQLIFCLIKKGRNFEIESYVKNFNSFFNEYSGKISDFFSFFYSDSEKKSSGENISESFFSFDDFNKSQNSAAGIFSSTNTTENEYMNINNEINEQNTSLYFVNFLRKKLLNEGIGDLKDILSLNSNNRLNYLYENENLSQFSDHTSHTKTSSSFNAFNSTSPHSDLVFFNNSSNYLFLSSSFLNGVIKKSLNYYHLLIHCPYNFFFVWKKLRSLFIFYILSVYNIYYKNLYSNINLETKLFQDLQSNLQHFISTENITSEFEKIDKEEYKDENPEDTSNLYYNLYIENYIKNFFLTFLYYNNNEKNDKKEEEINSFQYVKDFMPSYQDIKDNEFFLYFLNNNLYSPIFFHPYDSSDSYNINSTVDPETKENPIINSLSSTFSSYTSSNYSRVSDDQSQYFTNSFYTPSFPNASSIPQTGPSSSFNQSSTTSSVYSNFALSQNGSNSDYILNPFLSFDFFNNPDHYYFNNFSSYSFLKDFLPEKNKSKNEFYEIILVCENCLILSEVFTFYFFFTLFYFKILIFYLLFFLVHSIF